MALGAMLLLSGRSDEASASGSLQTCLNSGLALQAYMSAIADCYHAELERQDRILNYSYRSLMRNLGPDKRKELQGAQRQWASAHRKKCDLESEADGNASTDDGRMIWWACMVRENDQRIAWLRHYPQAAD
jgi:uncharacterized protein YecT (DUF1311 family)